MAEIKYKDVLADFITDIDNNPNLTDEEIFKAYPEFNNDKKLLDAAYQYRNTWKANDYDEPTLQSKFPEFFTPAQPSSAQPANPRVNDNPAPTIEAEYHESLRKQDAASGATNDPNQPFVAPQDDNQAYKEQMLRTSEAMRRNAERMAQRTQQAATSIPQPSLSLAPQDGSMGAALERMQRQRLPEIRKHTIANNMLNETAQSLGELQRADREKWMAQGEGMTPTQRSYLAQAYTEDPYLAAANSVLYNAEVRMQDAKRQNGISWKNIGEGLASFGKDTGRHLLTKLEGMASFGMSDLRNAKYQRDVLKKVADAEAFDNPDAVLTPQEKALYDATVTNIAVEIARQNDTSRWSKAGQITADMIPFIEDIMLGNALFKGFGDAGRKAITKGVEKHVKNKLAKWLLTNVGDVAMSAGESAATAAILPHTFANMYGNMTQADMDKVGMNGYRMTLGGVKEQGAAQAWGNAYRDQVKELFTETGGNFRLIGRALIDNPLGKKILKTPFGIVLKRFEGAKGGAGSRLASMTMYHGVLGEWLEELEGAIYDGNLKDFFTADTQLPMLLSFSVPAAFTGGLNAGQHAYLDAKYKSAGKTIDKLIDASAYVGPDKNTLKGQIMATLYQTPTENLPQAIGMCVEQVYPQEYKALMEGAPEKGNKAAELAYALKEYLASGTVLTVFDPDMLGGQIADVQAHREQMRQQATEAAQAAVQNISHEDGNIYRVGIKGKDDVAGYAFRGDLDVVPDKNGAPTTRGRDLITIKMDDGTTPQVPADELVILDAPQSAQERIDQMTEHYFAQYANNDLFQIGDKVHIMQDGQPSEDSSTIVNINDEGVEVEIIDPNGQPNTTIIPHEQAAEMLSKAEGTEDGIVTFQMRDGNTVRLRDMGDGTFASIVSEGEQPYKFTAEELESMGAKRVENPAQGQPIINNGQPVQGAPVQGQAPVQPVQGQAPAAPVQPVQPAQPQIGSNAPGIDELSAEDLASQTVTFMQSPKVAQGYLTAERAKVNAQLQQLEKEGVTEYNSAEEYRTKAQQLEQSKARLQAQLEKIDGAIAAINAQAEAAVARKNLNEAIRKRAAEFSKQLGANIVIFDSLEQIPESQAAARAAYQKVGDDLDAWYDENTGDIYMNANAFEDMQRFEEKVFHEVVSHKGLDQLLGKAKYDKLCDAVWNSMSEASRNQYMAYARATHIRGSEKEFQRIAAKEYIAFLSEKRAALELNDQSEEANTIRSEWAKICDFLRELFKKIFGNVQITDEDLAKLVHASFVNMQRQAQGITEEQGETNGVEAIFKPIMDAVAQWQGQPLINGLDPKKIGLSALNPDYARNKIRQIQELLNKPEKTAEDVAAIDGILGELYGALNTLIGSRQGGNENNNAESLINDIALQIAKIGAISQELLDSYVNEFAAAHNEEVSYGDNGFDSYIGGNSMWMRSALDRESGNTHDAERAEKKRRKEEAAAAAAARNKITDEQQAVIDQLSQESAVGTTFVDGKSTYTITGVAHENEDGNMVVPVHVEKNGKTRDFEEDAVVISNKMLKAKPAAPVKQETKEPEDHTAADFLNEALTETAKGNVPANVTIDETTIRDEEDSVEMDARLLIDGKPSNLSVTIFDQSLGSRGGYDPANLVKYYPFDNADNWSWEKADVLVNFFNKGEHSGKASVLDESDAVYFTSLQAAMEFAEFVNSEAANSPEVRLAIAEAETDPNPTEAQKKAENYKQGHVTLWGLPITIENPKGSIRRGTDANGKQWEQEMHHTYGKIRRTEGVDGDHIDVFIGPNLTSDKVFVVDQRNVDTGEFDEHKVMLGFDSLEDAQNGYLSNYEEGWQGMGTVTEVTMDEFKKWIDSSTRKTKPFAEYKSVKPEGGQSQEQAPALAAEVIDPNAPLNSLSDVKKLMDAIGYEGTLSKVLTDNAGKKFVKYQANGVVTPNIYLGETTPRDILEQFYLYDNVMGVNIPADLQAEFDKEKARAQEVRNDLYASDREQIKQMLTEERIPFVDVVDSERGSRIIFTDRKNENGNYTDWMDVSDADRAREDISFIRAKAATYNRETSETPAEDLTPLEAAKKRKAARNAAKAAEQAAQTQGESEMLTRLRELQEGEDQQAPQDYLHSLTDEQLDVLEDEVNELWNKARTENNLRDLNDQQIREQYPEAWKTLLLRNRVSAENSRRYDMQITEESIANRKAHTESEELRRYYEYEFAYMRASASKGDVLKAVHDAEEYLAGLSYEELAKIYNEIVRLQSEHDVPWILNNAYKARSANMENEGVFDYGLNHQGEIPEGKANKPKINASDWTAKDDLRPVLQGVYHDPTGVGVVTNAHILMATPSLYDPAQDGKIVKKDGSTVDGKFPDWQGVVDQARRINKKEATVDWTAIRNFIAGIKAKMKEEGNPLKKDSLANIIFRMPDGQVIIYRLNMFIPFADAAAAVGANTLHYSPINGQTLAEVGDSHLVIMPVDPESFRKNLDWGYKDNFYYDLQPKQDEPVSAETPKTESKPERKPKPTRKKAAPAEQTQAPVETDAEVIETQKPKNTDKIEDVGEKIGGARKDIVQETVDRINVNGDTFAKIFPKFDYHKLIANGLEPRLAAGLKYVCEHAKKSYKIRKKRFGEKNALEATRFMANYAKGYLLGDTSLDFTSEGWVFTAYGKRRYEFGIKLWESLREAMGDTMFDVDLSGYDCDIIPTEEERRAEAVEAGRKFTHSTNVYYRRNADGESVEFTPRYAINTPKGDKLFTAEEYDQAVQYFQDQVTSAINYQAANPFELAIYRKRGSDDCCVHAKIGGKWVELTPWGKEYGLKYRDEHRAELQAMAQRKAEELKEQRKNTRPEAKVEVKWFSGVEVVGSYRIATKIGKEYVPISDPMLPKDIWRYAREHHDELQAKAQELLNAYLDEQEANRGWKPQLNIGGLRNRVGTDWRNGADVTAERFRTEFGFRGVEFGNYVTQKERQRLLNECFDALHDMAEILGVSPRALSLNGQLGFAIGARGGAGAKAHYEPGKNVINLTKKNGWGALAHEWWHAMDYYFGKREKERPATGGVFRDDVRKQMQDAFAAVMKAINGSEYLKRSQNLDAKTNKHYYAEDTELGARAFEDYIAKQLIERGQVNDFLSHHTSEEDWNGDISNYPYPIEKDGTALADAFQSFFDTVEEQEDASTGNSVLFSVTDKKYAQFALTQANNPMLDDVHTGIRSVEDIHTLEETLNDDKLLVTEPDWEEEDIRRAIDDNQVTIYSSKPIQDGTFVTPSRMVAEDYAGGEIVYEKTVSPDKVAWIASDEGQYADVDHYDGNILFSITNANNEIFYSNAERAVEGIKQDKATPEQWRAMIEKAGGLKAGEDKWLGLSDWLAQQRPTIESHPDETPLQFAQRAQAERKKFTISKQEILHYIRANKIQIEETEYGETTPENNPTFRAFQDEVTEMWENVNRMQNGRFNEAVQDIIRFEDDMQAKYGDDWRDLMDDSERNVANYLQERRDEINMEVFLPEEVVMEEMCNRHGDDFQLAFSIDDDGSLSIANEDAAGYYLDVNPINDTRLQYTTEGLTNKHEIAMTVPTIEAWNETDEIHFGDAGEGRAIAWVRFGDAKTVSKPEELVQAEQGYKEFSRKMIGQYGLTYTERVMSDSERQQESDLIAKLNQARKDHPQVEEKVLVIDEIQSKRHQDGREYGYVDSETAIKYRQLEKEVSKAQLEYHDYRDQLWKKYENQVRTRGEMLDVLTPEEKSKHTELQEKYENLYDRWEDFKMNIPASAIPAAPFEKNWHELAMKRILRYAAENGYDKVAWTTGDQQAERYDIGEFIESITRNEDEDYPYSYEVVPVNGSYMNYDFDENGIYHDDGDPQMDGKSMEDIFGKDLAKRLKEMPAGEKLDGNGLRIGAEGMKGFYDEILPRFLTKYGKKWGAQVGSVQLPELREKEWENGERGGLKMHSIDITPEMRESVLQGQPMFSITPKNTSLDQVLFSIKVNHNSPFLLKKADGAFVDPATGERLGFDHRFMSAGEGGQAHGWGSYFSVNDLRNYASSQREFATYQGWKAYQLPLTVENIPAHMILQISEVHKGRTFEHMCKIAKDILNDYRADIAEEEGTLRGSRIFDQMYNHDFISYDDEVDLLNKYEQNGVEWIKSFFDEIEKGIDALNADDFLLPARHHYDVEIPDNNGTNYIEEEQPLSKEQIERLRKANEELAQEDIFDHGYTRKYQRTYPFSDVKNFLLFAEKQPEQYPFRSFYGDLESFMGANMHPEYITKLLQRAGFDGIHYEGQRDGECYVIFNENDAKIVNHVMFSITPKAERIEKLRNSEPVVITGNEIAVSDVPAEQRRIVKEYMREHNLKGEYTNADTGSVIQVQYGRKNGGVMELLQHDFKNPEHIQSIAAIPQIIEKSIYIDSAKNWDKEKNPEVTEYQYFVCGLKIGDEDYTVRSSIAIDRHGNRYYDHKLTHMEKGKLLDLSGRVTNPARSQAVADNGSITNSERKDNTLFSILQINPQENAENLQNSSENADLESKSGENGEQTPKNTSLDQVLFSITVNHNSPYLLKKADGSFVDPATGERLGFDHRFIGSGEGAQAHGWGSYFSQNDIEGYRQETKTYKDEPVAADPYSDNAADRALFYYEQEGGTQKAVKFLRELMREEDDADTKREYQECIDVLLDEKSWGERKGHRYIVEIPDNDGTNYLDEMKTLPKPLRRKIAAAVRELPGEPMPSVKYVNYTGGWRQLADMIERNQWAYLEIRDRLFNAFGGYPIDSEKRLSKLMSSLGFVGVHYDGRRDGECYVIFDENDAKIVDHVMFSITEKDPVKRWEAENPKPKAKEDEPTIDYAKRLQQWNNEHRKVKDAIKDAQPSYDHETYDGVLFSMTPPVTGETLGDVATSARQRSDLNRKRRESAAITDMLIQLSKDNYWRMQEALHKINADIKSLRRAMRLQSNLDKKQVEELLHLYQSLIESTSEWAKPGDMPETTGMIFKNIVESIGKEDITEQINNIMVYLSAAQRTAARNQWYKLRTTELKKLNISGVVTQGKVAVQGQHAIQALNEALSKENGLTLKDLVGDAETGDEGLIGRMMEEEDKATTESLKLEYKGKWIGYTLAAQHMERMEQLNSERKELEADKRAAENNEHLKPFVKAELIERLRQALVDNDIAKADAYMQSTTDLQDYVTMQTERAKNFLQHLEEWSRRIRNMAAEDLSGVQADPLGKDRKKSKVLADLSDWQFSTARDMQSLLRFLGRNTPDGKGALYNHYFYGYQRAADTEFKGIMEATDTMGKKVAEIFGKGYKTFEDVGKLCRQESKRLKLELKDVFDGVNNVDIPISVDNALYIYAVSKMDDGMDKLLAMNISREDVANLIKDIDPRLIELVDWVQNEFFVNLRNRYNPTHESLYGAPMDKIENYFPLRIARGSLQKNVDVAEDENDASRLLPGTSTGAIKRRTKNAKPLDILAAGFLTETVRHITQMEKWNAFAQWTRDTNILLSDIMFRERVKALNSYIYGENGDVYAALKKAMQMANGTYKSAKESGSTFTLNVAKGATSAKINFRVWTAMKQIASHPAVIPYLTNAAAWKEYGKIMVNPYQALYGARQWALETLPAFQKRISKRDMGDMRLMRRAGDWEWQRKILEASAKYGMFSNMYVDTLTCAHIAKVAYESTKADLLSKGYTEEQATEKALLEAEIAFNTSQQSSESGYMAPVQSDRTWNTVVHTVFRVSPIQYTREWLYYGRNIGRKMKKGAKERMVDSRMRFYMLDGLSREQAQKAAESDYRKALAKDIAGFTVYGWLMNAVWRLMAAVPYLLLGDDDDEKKKLIKRAMTWGFYASPITGLFWGGALESALDRGDVAELFDKEMPITSDIVKAARLIKGGKAAEVASASLNVLVQSTIGFDIAQFTENIADAVIAVKSDQDMSNFKKARLVAQSLMSVPKSQWEQVLIDKAVEDAPKQSNGAWTKYKFQSVYDKYLEDYIEYYSVHQAPLTFWARGEENEQKMRENAEKKYRKLLRERGIDKDVLPNTKASRDKKRR